MIYFVQAGENGPIKIGATENIEDEIAALQIGNPQVLHLLGVIPERRELHYFFNYLYLRGEWFKSEEALLEFIEQFTAKDPKSGWEDQVGFVK